MKVFLEIGYTNSKIVINNNEEVNILANSSYDLASFLSNFDFINDNLYVLNNNNKFDSLLNTFKQHHNFFLFDHNINNLNLKISSDINTNELGDDLRFLIYYLGQQKQKNIILMSNGSCLVTIVKKDDLVQSISINLGTSTSLNVMKNTYQLDTNKLFFNGYGTNTNDALALGEYLMLKGILMTTLENFHIKKSSIILCGNGYDENWLNNFKIATKLKFQYQPNLVLKTFRTWCLNNLD